MAQSDAEIMKLVLEAEDRLTPDLTKLEQRIQSLTWSLVDLSESSKIDFRELTWSDRELALLHNSIIDNTTALEGLTKWTDEYNITLHALMKSVDSYIDKKQQLEDIATQEVIETLKRQQAVADYNYEQKMSAQILQEQESELQNYVKQTSNVSQSIEYWKQKLEEVKVALSDQAAKLKDAEQTYWKTSKQANAQREELQKLEKEYKELNRTLKDAKQNQWFFADSLDIVRDKIKQNLALTIGKSLVSFAVQWVKEMARNIIEYWTQMNAVSLQFEQMSYRAGMSYTDLRDTLRESSKGMVSDIDLMQSANRAMSLWVAQDIESMSNLMKIAQVRWAQMWETTSKAFDDIVTWIWRQSAMILDNLWIVINSKDAYERYATSIGKTTDQLTKQEKQQAITNEVIRQSGEELKARENMPLTVAQKIDKLKVSAVNSFAAIWDAFFKRTEPMLDEIIKISDKVTDSLTQATDEFNQSTSNIWLDISSLVDNTWWAVAELVWNVLSLWKQLLDKIAEWLGKVWDWIVSLLMIWADETAKWLNWMAWNWTDFFYFINLWLTWIASSLSAIFNIANSVFKMVTKKDFRDGLWDLVSWANRTIEQNKEYNALWRRDKILYDYNEAKDFFKEQWKDVTNTVDKEVNKVFDNLNKVYQDRLNDLENWYKSGGLWDWWKSIFGWDDDDTTWWGWSSKKTKKIEDAYKALNEEMKKYGKQTKNIHKANEEYYKLIDKLAWQKLKELESWLKDLEKEFDKAVDEVQKKIDDTTKNIKKLEEEIDKLNDKLSDIWKEENKSLAQEYIKARDELKKMEKEAAWIKQVAENTSWSELEDATWFIDWFNVEYIKKYKTYLDEVNSLYEWMSDEEIEALKEQIKYQEWFNSLNPIQQIKEEYRIKKEEIQNEIEEKKRAIEVEKEEKTKLETELNEIREKYTPIIEEQTKKIEELWKIRNQFEKDYAYRIKTNWDTELSYAEQLEIAWKKVADAKKSAFSSDWWWGWDVKWYADWGNVIAWRTILVGERWPELFVPRSNWTIVPNNEITNNNWIEININWITVRSEADIDVITDEIIRKIKLEKQFWIS